MSLSMVKFKCRDERKAPAGVVANLEAVLKLGSDISQTNQQKVVLNVLCGWIHDHNYLRRPQVNRTLRLYYVITLGETKNLWTQGI